MERGMHVSDAEELHRRPSIDSRGMPPVSVSVVVPSRGRRMRLRWLLNALAEQTIVEQWEVVVVHDYDSDTAARVLERHPLARARLRHIALDPGTGSAAQKRNLGWRAAAGELIVFTDDDCRPEPDWLERLVAVARRTGGVVQGRTRPDPFEYEVLRAPHVRTLDIEPVGPFAQTCNILYPRTLLERLGGFDEQALTGEDVDLSLRARALGVVTASAAEAVVYHAVESHTLPGILRENLKWRHLAYLVKRRPELRRELTLWVFWDAEHLRTSCALAGLLGGRVRRWPIVLAVPYVVHASDRRGSAPLSRLVSVAEIPGQAVRQIAEVLGMVVASIRYRTLLL